MKLIQARIVLSRLCERNSSKFILREQFYFLCKNSDGGLEISPDLALKAK